MPGYAGGEEGGAGAEPPSHSRGAMHRSILTHPHHSAVLLRVERKHGPVHPSADPADALEGPWRLKSRAAQGPGVRRFLEFRAVCSCSPVVSSVDLKAVLCLHLASPSRCSVPRSPGCPCGVLVIDHPTVTFIINSSMHSRYALILALASRINTALALSTREHPLFHRAIASIHRTGLPTGRP